MRELSFLKGFAISLVDDEVMQSQVPTTLEVIKKQNREKKNSVWMHLFHTNWYSEHLLTRQQLSD